ncbi:MAG: glycine cleavage system protein GcvH [Chloroflexota bacterium]|nr:glycine cleavage system protein GcvH [Chloroflexota bacterium]
MAYKTPPNLLYSSSHEWVTTDGEEVTVGITDYAQHALGDVVFVELPEVGRTLEQGDIFGVVESVKAASDLYVPVSGEVIEINETLVDAPDTVNNDPYGAGWMIKLRARDFENERGTLMDAAAYEQFAASEENKQ